MILPWPSGSLHLETEEPFMECSNSKQPRSVGVGGGYGWFRPDMSIPYVGTDNAAVARLAADHLLERGSVHFAYCGYRPAPVNGCSKRREQAILAVVVLFA